ncbi:hypothetical protein ACFLSW_01135 [Candidatus Bipolaricaulota bacterium]
MLTSRCRSPIIGLLFVLPALGGCAFGPFGPIPGIITGDPENLVLNPDASLGTQHWTVYTADAFVQSDSGNPTFTSRNGAYMWQIVDISQVPGAYAVLMGITATQTIAVNGMGHLHGDFRDAANPGTAIGYLDSNDMYSRSNIPNEWVVLAEYFPIPIGTGSVSIMLDASDLPGQPRDGAVTWFDDIALYVVDSEQEAQEIIDTYTADHTW